MRVTQGPALRDCGCPALPMLRRRAGPQASASLPG